MFKMLQVCRGLIKNAARSTNVAKSHACLTSYLSGKFYKQDSSQITQSCLPLNENFVFLLFYQMNFLNNFVRYCIVMSYPLAVTFFGILNQYQIKILMIGGGEVCCSKTLQRLDGKKV